MAEARCWKGLWEAFMRLWVMKVRRSWSTYTLARKSRNWGRRSASVNIRRHSKTARRPSWPDQLPNVRHGYVQTRSPLHYTQFARFCHQPTTLESVICSSVGGVGLWTKAQALLHGTTKCSRRDFSIEGIKALCLSVLAPCHAQCVSFGSGSGSAS